MRYVFVTHFQRLSSKARHAHHAGQSSLLLLLIAKANETKAFAEPAVVKNNCKQFIVNIDGM